MEPMDILELVFRWLHILAAITAVGGTIFARFVVLPPVERLKGINDSKKLTAGKREEIFSLLLQKAPAVSIGIVEVEEIDRLNILRASLKAMELAVNKLSLFPDFLLIDGIFLLGLPLAQQAIPKGDQRCQSIAAASIVAKVTRDRLMMSYHVQYPEYNFARHKGYGTKEHLRAIREHGCCPIHRQSFKSIYQPSLL